MQEHEVLGCVISEPIRPVPRLRTIKGVEVASVERGDDRVAEVGKQLTQIEGKLPAGLQEVVGERQQVMPFSTQDDHEIGDLTTVPVRSKFRFVGKPEGNVVLEGDQLEAPTREKLRLAISMPNAQKVLATLWHRVM